MKSLVKLQPENIPTELKSLPQWLVWRRETRRNKKTGEDKSTKVPYSITTGNPCDATLRGNHQAFDEVLSFLQKHSNTYDGLGFCLTKETGITGIDLDDAFESDGRTKSWAAEMLDILPINTYVEISPSGNGLRAFLVGRLSPGRRRKRMPGGESVEVYDSLRFLTVTGNRYGGGDKIPAAQNVIDKIHQTLFPDFAKVKESRNHLSISRHPSLSDEHVKSQMFASKNGKEIKELWDGGTGKYNDDESAADQALLCHLAFFTRNDPEQMERLFNESARGQREKWLNREDYRQRSIQNAIVFVNELSFQTEASKPGQIRFLNDLELREMSDHIRSIDPATSKKELPAILEQTLDKLAFVNEAQASAIMMEDVKKHFAFTDKELHPYLKALKEKRKQMRLESDELPLTVQQALEHLKSIEQVKEIHPALDFVDGVMYFGVMIESQLFLVSSERKLIDTNGGHQF